MNKVAAILSMLHEPPNGSATRIFAGSPVLHWTLERLHQAAHIASIAILCWEDQVDDVKSIADETSAKVFCKGERRPVREMDAITAAGRWADGWRGGPLGACHCDRGFYGPWHQEVLQQVDGDAALLIDPSSGLLDPELIDGLIAHVESKPELEFGFLPATPGAGAILIKSQLLDRFAATKAHPGQLLQYHPDRLAREPLAGDACAPVPASIARTVDRLTLDSQRQVRRLEFFGGTGYQPVIPAAKHGLVARATQAPSSQLAQELRDGKYTDILPREVILELNTDRSTRPISPPEKKTSRPPLPLSLARQLFEELQDLDDIRLTLAGIGDPLLHSELFAILDHAHQAGLAINLETDFLEASPPQIAQLAASPIDVFSVHVPGLTHKTYAAVMGCDGYARVIENIRLFHVERQRLGVSVPLLVPIFIKCRENYPEMELWYDQWLRAAGSAVIRGPSTCGGLGAEVSIADMSPPRRRPCGRLASRVTILCDGRIVSCEEDVLGRQTLGRLGSDSLADVWQNRFAALREDHRSGDLSRHVVCAGCKEWHRP